MHRRRPVLILTQDTVPTDPERELWFAVAAALRAAGSAPALVAPAGLREALGRLTRTGTPLRVEYRDRARWNPLWRLRALRLGPHVFDAVLRPTHDLAVIWQRGPFDGHRTAEWCRQHQIPYLLVGGAAWEVDWPPDPRRASLQALFEHSQHTFVSSENARGHIAALLGSPPPRCTILPLWHPEPECDPLPWPPEDGRWHLGYAGPALPVETGLDLLFDILGTDRWRNRAVDCTLALTEPLHEWGRLTVAREGCERFRLVAPPKHPQTFWGPLHTGVFPMRRGEITPALLDALRFGRPVVATRTGDLGRLVASEINAHPMAAPHRDCLAAALEAAWDGRAQAAQLGRRAASDLARRLHGEDAVTLLRDRIHQLAGGPPPIPA